MHTGRQNADAFRPYCLTSLDFRLCCRHENPKGESLMKFAWISALSVLAAVAPAAWQRIFKAVRSTSAPYLAQGKWKTFSNGAPIVPAVPSMTTWPRFNWRFSLRLLTLRSEDEPCGGAQPIAPVRLTHGAGGPGRSAPAKRRACDTALSRLPIPLSRRSQAGSIPP